jgi:1,4-alpha-glucan branching enzyme
MAGNRIIPSQRPFMGAMPYADGAGAGVTFRVWAPFAQQVNVAGEFNNWSKTAYALASEGNGYWSVDVPGAGVNQQYKFVLSNPIGNQFWRMDPYARSITDDGGNINGLIASSVEGYGTPGYSTPSWNELIIYELHIGTFTKDDAFTALPMACAGIPWVRSAMSKTRTTTPPMTSQTGGVSCSTSMFESQWREQQAQQTNIH